MRRPLSAALFAAVASLTVASPALGSSSYTVTGFGDAVGAPPCTEIQPTLFQCQTLRMAVTAANQLNDQDSISLPAGTYTLTQGQLALNEGVIIAGAGARSTIIQAAPSTRVFAVNGAAQLTNMTIQGGTFTGGPGGNILVGTSATLYLLLSRVTGGNAGSGGGIANGGVTSIQNSLIDNNHASDAGGGVVNHGSIGVSPELTVVASTFARNGAPLGGALRSDGNADNSVLFLASTIARNTGGGISLDVPQDEAELYASIIAGNGGPNCGSVPVSNGSFNVESGTDCLLGAANNVQDTDAGVAADLSNQGGETDVLTIPATSPAVDLVTPCLYPIDQRAFQRYSTESAPCDAGAYEQSATGNPQPPVITPVPTPVPTPVATATPVPTPVFNKTVAVVPVSGKVRLCPVRPDQCTDLVAGQAIPLGSTIDTKKGVVELSSVSKAGAPPQKAKFYDGIFKVTQSGSITDLTLNEPLAACKKAGSAAKKPKARKLWGDGKGQFRTKGKYSAATVRGTKWLVQDSCAGTLTQVKTGSVNVRDNVKKKTILRRAGQKYLARPKR